MSETFAIFLGLNIERLSTKNAPRFGISEGSSGGKRRKGEKGDKGIKTTQRAKVEVFYCGKVIPRVSFYIVPKKEKFEGQVVVGTRLTAQYKKAASTNPAEVSLSVRPPITGISSQLSFTSPPVSEYTARYPEDGNRPGGAYSSTYTPNYTHTQSYTPYNGPQQSPQAQYIPRSNSYDYSQQGTHFANPSSIAPSSGSAQTLERNRYSDRDYPYITPRYDAVQPGDSTSPSSNPSQNRPTQGDHEPGDTYC
jgi:hypothetical protein